MKSNLFILFSVLFFLSACGAPFLNVDPLAKVDSSLKEIIPNLPEESSVKLFTIDQSLSEGNEKLVMKTSIDYNSKFDHAGVYLFYHN